MTSVELQTSQEAFETLHGLADTRRHQIKVETQQVTQLLIDHSVMMRALRAAGVTVIDPPRRKRPHLNAGAPDLG